MGTHAAPAVVPHLGYGLGHLGYAYGAPYLHHAVPHTYTVAHKDAVVTPGAVDVKVAAAPYVYAGHYGYGLPWGYGYGLPVLAAPAAAEEPAVADARKKRDAEAEPEADAAAEAYYGYPGYYGGYGRYYGGYYGRGYGYGYGRYYGWANREIQCKTLILKERKNNCHQTKLNQKNCCHLILCSRSMKSKIYSFDCFFVSF